MTQLFAFLTLSTLAANALAANEGLRSEFPPTYRVHDPKGYVALASLYENAKAPAKPEDFVRVSLQDDTRSVNPNQIRCTMLGVPGEKPSQPYSVLYAYNLTADSKTDRRSEDLGPLLQAMNRDFLFLGRMSDGSPYDVSNALKLRDNMGWAEERAKDLVIHAQQLPGYYNTPVNIYLRKNGDFISFCLRRNDSNDAGPCEPDEKSRPVFSHDNLIVYGYCFNPSSHPKTVVGDLTKASPALFLSGAGDEMTFRNVIGRFGNNYYNGRARALTDQTLDIDTRVDYSLAANDEGPIRFLIAGNGNCDRHGVPIYPMAGLVQFKLTQVSTSEPKLTRFYDSESKSVVTFDTKRFRFCVIESDQSFAQRMQRSKAAGIAAPQGKMLTIVDWSFSHQDLRFYEMIPSSDPTYEFTLRSSGTFKGDSWDSSWGWSWGRGGSGGRGNGASHCHG